MRSTPTTSAPCARTGWATPATCFTATSPDHARTRTARFLLDDLRRGRTAHRPGVQPLLAARTRGLGVARRLHGPRHLARGPGAPSPATFAGRDEAHFRRPWHPAHRARVPHRLDRKSVV